MAGNCVVLSSMPVSQLMQSYILPNSFVIAADAGWHQAAALGITPDLVVGDFDSSNPPPAGVEVVRLLPNKNETDTYYAVKEAVTRGYRDVTLLGAMGGRFDHTFANMQTLLFLSENNAVNLMANESVEIRCMPPGTVMVQRRPDCYISVFSAGGSAKGVTLTGVKYPLQRAELMPDFPLGVSNEFLPDCDASISFKEGFLYVMLVKKDNYAVYGDVQIY